MNIKITPSRLKGTVNAPSSKSYSHRMLIAAALADGVSHISNITASNDIKATCSAMESLGAEISSCGSDYTVKGIGTPALNADIDCGESGSTLRFLIPIAAALGTRAVFNGHANLPNRPVTAYIRELGKKGIRFDRELGLPPTIEGKLEAGEYLMEGDVSSQYITGLMFALPLCSEDSIIKLTSPLQSKPYADMTVAVLSQFGVRIVESSMDGLPIYLVKGNQRYKPCDGSVEGYYSQAAFFFTANALGSYIKINNLNPDTVQGDRAIVDIVNGCTNEMKPFSVDVSDIPDLVPILAVLGSFTKGKSRLYNAARLKIKECDRLAVTAETLNALGGRVTVGDDYLETEPIDSFKGGTVDSHKDHRIVMAAAIAATRSDNPVTITNAQDVGKSYPKFFEDYASLGGIFTEV